MKYMEKKHETFIIITLSSFDNVFYSIVDLADKQRGCCGAIQCSVFSITGNTDA